MDLNKNETVLTGRNSNEAIGELFYLRTHVVCPKTHSMSGKYNYRSDDDITDAINKTLADMESEMKVKAVLVCTSDIVAYGDITYVKAIAYLVTEDGRRTPTFTAFAKEENGMIKGSQGTGSATSYASKMAKCMLAGVTDGVDPDSINLVDAAVSAINAATSMEDLNRVKDVYFDVKDDKKVLQAVERKINTLKYK